MKLRLRRYGRGSLLAVAALLVAGWFIPSFLSAERYRRRLEAGLQQMLHRPVTFGAISFRLLPRPGFSIENAVLRENPVFGSEPFARVDRIECDLRWSSLWRSRLELARLRLERPSLNIVRGAQGQWNVENLLIESGVALPAVSPFASPPGPPGDIEFEASEGRLNFKLGEDKKPFAITDLNVRLRFVREHGRLRFRLEGSPVRTDLSLPTPGLLELEGEWSPGKDLQGPLKATLRTRSALLYNWVPLVTGRNPQVYGVLDSQVRLSGSIRVVKMDGQVRLEQLHPWEQIPPADSMPWMLHFRGEFDRNRGRAYVESLDASFAQSQIHVSGSVDRVPTAPEVDLVVALERSRLEDLMSLGNRFWGNPGNFGVTGRVDGLLAIRGPWPKRRYGGFLGAQNVRLITPSGTFPVSEVRIHIDTNGARLAPVKLSLAPRVDLLVEGLLDRRSETPRYDLSISAKAIPLQDLMRFARAVGLRAVQNLDAHGVGTATFHLAASAWPLRRPTLMGRAEVQAAQLLAPGLTEPLNIPRARIEVRDDRILAEPVVAVIGTSVFAGRLEHRGEWKRPWKFNLRANSLSLEQGALWFDVLGHRRPIPLLERLPGLGSFGARRAAASNLFAALNARGHFTVPVLTCRLLTLREFRTSVEISDRKVHFSQTRFRLGSSRAQGSATVNLAESPARLSADISLSGADLQPLAGRLPVALRHLRGSASGTGHFEARGLTRQEFSSSLKGQAAVHLKNVFLGDFDPLESVAREAGGGTLEPVREEATIPSASATLLVGDRRVQIEKCLLDLAGARLSLSGSYAFDGTVALDIAADLRHVARRWVISPEEGRLVPQPARLRLSGPLDHLTLAPEPHVSRASP